MAPEETSLPFQNSTPKRTPEETTRLAWLVVSLATLGFLSLCALIGYAGWRYRAYWMVAQEGNTLDANTGSVSLIPAGEVAARVVPQGESRPLREGETVRIAESAPPGLAALVTLWDDSTLQLFAGTRVTFYKLQATRYSSRRQDVVLGISAGQVLVGVAQMENYQQVNFQVLAPQAEIALEPGGSYLLRVGETTEVAVLYGRAHVSACPECPSAVVEMTQKATVGDVEEVVIVPVGWELVQNGDFYLDANRDGVPDGWTFHRDEIGNGESAPPSFQLKRETIEDQPVWVVLLEREGALVEDPPRLATAILSQEIAEDLHPYSSVRLEFDLNILYQKLEDVGPLGTNFPFAVRIRYLDEDGMSREYLYGFFYRPEEGVAIEVPTGVEATYFPHYRWEHVSLNLREIEPRPGYLIGVDLLASGHDYRSMVTNLTLTAR